MRNIASRGFFERARVVERGLAGSSIPDAIAPQEKTSFY
jgi:hypothetical protein